MKTAALALGLMVLGFTSQPAWCASVVGAVADAQGHPVANVLIKVQNPAGKLISQATTDLKGQYKIAGLTPGKYEYLLDPGTTGFKPGSAVSYLDTNGMTINWKLSPNASAIALANQGTQVALAGDPLGMTWPGFLGFDALVAAGLGGTIGGVAAVGGFSSSPASPSL
jgi:hypothetical protein